MLEFLKKLWSALDTAEGVAVVVALAWALLARFTAIPLEIAVPGFGVVSPANLLMVAVPIVLAKMGWTPPFQPIKPMTASSHSRVATMVIPIAFVFFVLSGATPAAADPLYDWKRIAAGADVGVVYAESIDPAKPLEPGLRIAPYLSASVSEQLSLVAKYGQDVTHGRGRATAGARIAVVGFEPGDRVQAGFMFDRVWYLGDGADFYETTESWAGGIAMSWLAAKSGERDLLYAKVQAAYDAANGYDVSLALGINLIGGKP